MLSTIFVLLILPLLVGVVSVECEYLLLALVSPPLRKSQCTTDDDDFDEIPDDALYPSSLCALEEEEEEEEEEEDANHRKHKEKKTVLFSVMKLLSRVVVFVKVVCTKDFDAAL
jgi:hypothetical protein